MKRLCTFLMILALVLGCLTGCKSTSVEEESAVVDEYVASTPVDEGETDAPERVESSKTPETVVDDNDGSADVSVDGAVEETPAEDNDTATDNGEKDEPLEDKEDSSDHSYNPANKLKILDYNVRYADDGENKMISDRAPRLQKLVEQLDPDLMGFQEATPTWMGLLKGYFGNDYEYSYKERAPGDESSPVFWKKDKFEKMKEGYFWLSETPDTQSKGWDAGHYRICSWVRLKVKATGTEFLYFNAHWDGGDTVHIGSAQVTLARARQLGAFNKYAMILTADFNMVPWSAGYRTLVESGELSDVNGELENLQDGTVDGYNEGKEAQRIIDMCFYSIGKAEPVSYKILNEKIDGGYISDHRGLLVEVALL